MKFFIDTANLEDIRKANDMGVIDFVHIVLYHMQEEE